MTNFKKKKLGCKKQPRGGAMLMTNEQKRKKKLSAIVNILI
jgi:hypothetical protein